MPPIHDAEVWQARFAALPLELQCTCRNYAEAEYVRVATAGVPGRCRYAGPDGLGRPIEDCGAEGRRRCFCVGCDRRRRLGRLSDRQDQGAHGHRIREGKLTWRETVEQGIENAPT